MNALVVDDEPLARAHLRRLLEAQGVEIVGEAESVVEALDRTERETPDIVFLDIQMPGLTGLQMAAALLQMESPPLVVFVTGYSEHAVTAFENDAMDYLLKPVSADRLVKTLERARTRLDSRNPAPLPTPQERAEAVSAADAAVERSASADSMPPALRRLPVRGDYAVRLLRLEEIEWAEAREKRTYVRTRDNAEHRTYYTLTQLEKLLPAESFFRIHDSYLVPLDRIEELLFLGNHAYEVRLTTGKRIPVGRTRYAELRRRLGLAPVDEPLS